MRFSKITIWMVSIFTLSQVLWWAYVLNYLNLNHVNKDYADLKHLFLFEGGFSLIVWSTCLYFSYRSFQESRQKASFGFETILQFASTLSQQTTPQNVLLSQLVRECLQLPTLETAPNLQIDVDLRRDFVVRTAPFESKLVLKSILENASRYCTANNNLGRIKITAERISKRVSLVIKDNGIGIARGTGMDLSLVQQLSKRAGLQILLEDDNRNLSTTTRLFWEKEFS